MEKEQEKEEEQQEDDDECDSSDECYNNNNEENNNLTNVMNSVPIYSPNVWMISVRPVRKLTKFSELSLLFQPDIRLFCHRGINCRMNQEHQLMYCHNLPIFTPIITPDNPYGIPGVIKTWLLNNNNNIFQDEMTLPDQLRNNKIIIYIHGHRTRFLKSTAALNHLQLRFPGYTILGFLWPSHSRKESYILARSKASNEAALRLREVLITLQLLGNKSYIVAHSMGVRLALHALSIQLNNDELISSELQNMNYPLVPIECLFMIGAAIPSNAFHQGDLNGNGDNCWNISNLLVKKIYNFFSSNDSVLSSAYTWAEALSYFSITPLFDKDSRAMGSIGIVENRNEQISLQTLNETLKDIDVSDEVLTHSVHAYLASPKFKEYVENELLFEG